MLDILTKPSWTPEREDDLRLMVKNGHPDSAIARQMGISRNAVIGKRARMGLRHATRQSNCLDQAATARINRDVKARRNPQPAGADRTSRGAINRITKAHRTLRAKVLSGESDLHLEGDGVSDLPPDQSPCAVSFFAVTDRQCRWPLGEGVDFKFCGGPIMGGMKVTACAYCARHAGLAYRGRSEVPNRYHYANRNGVQAAGF